MELNAQELVDLYLALQHAIEKPSIIMNANSIERMKTLCEKVIKGVIVS